MEKSTKAANHNKGPVTKKKKKSKRLKKWLWIGFITIATAVFCAIIIYGFIIINGNKLLNENIDKLVLPEASIIYDKNGKEASKLSGPNRESVTYAELPDLVKDAFIATEDRRFEEHEGIDYIAIARALLKDVLQGSAAEGGSTITQQLARNLFLNNDKTIFRKATEMSIATALESNFTKDEILEKYLNRIYFGDGAYGIKAAAKTYFGKDNLEELELWEIATLAAIPKSPTYYNPIDYPDRSKQRRDTVLLLMADQGKITVEQKINAQAQPVKVSTTRANDKFPSYVDMVLREAAEVTGISEEELNRNGYSIYTALDVKAQTALEQAYENPELFPEDGPEQIVQSSMVILDNQDGGIAAIIGGRDYVRKGFNRALEKRQPGSAFKPIAVYGPALETGEWHPNSMLEDKKQSFGTYNPRNLNGKYSGTISMTDAVRRSINLPTVWLLNEIGVKKGFDFAKSLGIEMDKEDRNLAIALGGLTHGASPLEMARAYSAFADNGTLHTTHTIISIKDKNNKELYSFKAEDKQVMSEQTAWYSTLLLKGVVDGGTGAKAKIKKHQVAGKTGTTQSGIKGVSGNRDIWFVGYTAQYSAAVWMGFADTNKDHILSESSGKTAALFSQVMTQTLEGSKSSAFKKPAGVEDIPPVKTSINPVKDVTAVYVADTSEILINWTSIGEDLEYRLFRKSSTEPFELLLTTKLTAVQDFNIRQGDSYHYYVIVFDPEVDLESEASNIIEVQIPAEDEEEIVDPGTESGSDPDTVPETDPGTDPGTDTDTDTEPQVDDEATPDIETGDVLPILP
ncbi:MAG: PBP1A family penicillin-binding protein [Paenibacillaceae bacterium]